jgi:hypothetical protein
MHVLLKKGGTFMRRQVKSHYESNALVGNNLIDIFAKYGSIKDMKYKFNKKCTCNAIIWNASL